MRLLENPQRRAYGGFWSSVTNLHGLQLLVNGNGRHFSQMLHQLAKIARLSPSA